DRLVLFQRSRNRTPVVEKTPRATRSYTADRRSVGISGNCIYPCRVMGRKPYDQSRVSLLYISWKRGRSSHQGWLAGLEDLHDCGKSKADRQKRMGTIRRRHLVGADA